MCKQAGEETPVQTTADTEDAKALRVRDQILKAVEDVFDYIEDQDEYDGYFQEMGASEQVKVKVSMLVAQEAVRRVASDQLAEMLNTAMVKVKKEMFGV